MPTDAKPNFATTSANGLAGWFFEQLNFQPTVEQWKLFVAILEARGPEELVEAPDGGLEYKNASSGHKARYYESREGGV